MPNSPILEIKNLKTYFPVKSQSLFGKRLTLKAVDDISFKLYAGATIGIVGESGCGKSTLAKTISKLIPSTAGEIIYKGQDIASLKHGELKAIRSKIQYVFQDPYESLNPRHTIQNILEEPFVIHEDISHEQRLEKVKLLISKVGLPLDCLQKYPHEFSGGQRQRIGIARAIALNPEILICDEPVSALDVSVQSQIINLLMDLQDELGLSVIFIAHDLTVVKHISDYIAVMYLGEIVELSESKDLFLQPQHPYTQLLINAIPIPDPNRIRKRAKIEGELPSPINLPSGCRFSSRCTIGDEGCVTKSPQLLHHAGSKTHQSSCHKIKESLENWIPPWE